MERYKRDFEAQYFGHGQETMALMPCRPMKEIMKLIKPDWNEPKHTVLPRKVYRQELIDFFSKVEDDSSLASTLFNQFMCILGTSATPTTD